MRKVNSSVLNVIQEIEQLKGESISMEINRGRKKIEKYQGIIENIYPSIFTVNIGDGKNTLSYSYYPFTAENARENSKKPARRQENGTFLQNPV